MTYLPEASMLSQVGKAKKTKAAGKQKKSYVPRPMNAWMIYRKAKSSEIAASGQKMSQSQMSQMISKQWKSEGQVVKAHYEQLAAIEARNHKALYPNYKYQPVSKEEKARQKELEKREKQIEKAALRKSKVPEPSPTPVPMLGHQVPYHLAAQHASLGPSPPYSTGSLPSSASTPSTSSETYDSTTTFSMCSSATSYTSSPPASDLPQFAMPDDHPSPSTIVPTGSTSTSRVPSGTSVVYHPNSPVPTPTELAMQFEWHVSEGPFAAPQVSEETAVDAFSADHASEDASQQPLYSEQFTFEDFLNPPQNEQLSVRTPPGLSRDLAINHDYATRQDVLNLELPIRSLPDPWVHQEVVEAASLLKEGWDQSVYTLPDVNVENLDAANALQVNVVSNEEPTFTLSPQDEADLTAYLQSIAAPGFDPSFTFDDLSQVQQQQQTSSIQESIDMFAYTTLEDAPQQQFVQYDNPQYYPSEMLESQAQVDPSHLVISSTSASQFTADKTTCVTPTVEQPSSNSNSYTPPPGASRAGARRVAGSWRPRPEFMAPTPPATTPQYLSPMPSSTWNGVQTS